MGQTFKDFAGGDSGNVMVIETAGEGDTLQPDDLMEAADKVVTPVVPPLKTPGL